MSRLRKILLVLFFAIIAGGMAGAWLVWNGVRQLNPEDLRKLITTAVKSASGLDLVTGRVTTRISYHFVIMFDDAQLLDGNERVARFHRITLVCGYRTLIFHRGLPFLSVVMEQPEMILPVNSVLPGPMPVMDAATVRDLRRVLVRLSNITRQVMTYRATVEDRAGRVLFDDAAVRATHGRLASAWQLGFNGYFRGVGLPSFKLGADLALAPEMDGPEVPFARGSLWFWNASLQEVGTRGFSLKGNLNGNLTFLVGNDGVVKAQALTRASPFQLSSDRLEQPLRLAELSVSARISHSSSGMEVTQFVVRAQGQELISGAASLTPLPPDNLRIRARLSSFSLGTEQVKTALLRVRGLPDWLSKYARIVTAGNFNLDQLTLDSTFKDLEAPTAAIFRHMILKATLDGIAFTPPGLPSVAEMYGKLEYVNGLVGLTQGHASFGASTLSEIRLNADLIRGAREIPYQARVAGDFDLGEIFPSVHVLLPAKAAQNLTVVEKIGGKAAAELDLHGRLTDFALAQPQYKAVIRPQSVIVATTMSPFRIFGGSVVIEPTQILIDRLDLTPKHGSMRVSGRIERPTPGSLEIADLNLQLHHVPAEDWLPHLIALDTMDVHAPASGNIAMIRVRDGARPYQVNGNLAVGPGEVKFGFLRSPIILTDLAALSLDGQGGKLTMRQSSLEGALLDMTIAVADVTNPIIQIHAQAQRLDLEAIRAIRLPWTPKTPIRVEHSHFVGQVQAQEANLSRLNMKDLRVNFERTDQAWRVWNINADALGGHLAMDLAGRKRDDWVHITSNSQDLDIAQVQALANNQPVVTGRVSSDADLWFDTNGDFYNTLTGTISPTITNGVLLKLKMLSQMLSLVDVSEWLKANIPNLRVNGVPFNSITAKFRGQGGIFQTDDFLLDGPVMKITAAGQVDLGQSTMSMTIGMRPFQLLDTVFNQIPIIGTRLAESQSGIVAAYFNVRGPVGNPTVLPAPIKSISHMVIKTLAIPINILIPETIK